MKKIILIILTTAVLFGWEINTHRAIDQTAITGGRANNFYDFLVNSGIGNQVFNNRNSIMFDTYGMTYMDYVIDGEEDGISNDKWNQVFSNRNAPNAIDLIEAGTILEDAVWAGGLFSGDGRFNNHFYDPQNGGKPLSFGWGSRTDAVSWAKNNMQEEV
jgi:hypothetical protein